jgi:hypothetical protein
MANRPFALPPHLDFPSATNRRAFGLPVFFDVISCCFMLFARFFEEAVCYFMLFSGVFVVFLLRPSPQPPSRLFLGFTSTYLNWSWISLDSANSGLLP